MQDTSEIRKECTEENSQYSTRKFIDFSVWKVPSFAIVAVCSAGISIVIFTPQVYLVRYCEDLNIPGEKSSKLLMMYGLTSCVLRIAIGKLCDIKWINPIYVFQAGLLTCGVAVKLFGVPSSFMPLAVLSVLYGIGDGTSLTSDNLLLLTTVEPAKRASAFGLANMLISVSVATGAPLSGFIADQAGSYALAFYIAGSIGILFSCLPFILLCLRRDTSSEDAVKPINESEEDTTPV